MTIDFTDLLEGFADKVKEDVKTMDDLVNLESCLNRELFLGDVGPGSGVTLDGYITFWNRYDDEHNIPVEERKPIKIFIDSNGGDASEDFIIVDAIEKSKTPIWTIAVGKCYSSGFDVIITGHKRFAYKHASFMMHEGGTGMQNDAHKFVNYTNFYKKQLEMYKDHVVKHTKITPEYYDEIRRDDFWLTAEEALELGIIDEIVG